MTLVSTIDNAIAQLQALRRDAEELERAKSQATAIESKLADFETELNRNEQTKARLIKEITDLRLQIDVLRGEKLAEREARREVINEAHVKLKELNDQIVARQGQRDQISTAISELRSKFG